MSIPLRASGAAKLLVLISLVVAASVSPTAGIAQGSPLRVELYSGWNMIGVVEDTPYAAIQNQADKQGGLDSYKGQSLWCYNSSNQDWIVPPPSELKPGQGCYIASKGRSTILLPGSPAKTTISLNKGWNMISVPVDTALSKFEASAMLEEYKGFKVWHFDGESQKWTNPTVLVPGKGYYVLGAEMSSVTLTLDQTIPAKLSYSAGIPMSDWLTNQRKGASTIQLDGPLTLAVDDLGVYDLHVKPDPSSSDWLRIPGTILVAFPDDAGYAPVPPALLVSNGSGYYDPFNLEFRAKLTKTALEMLAAQAYAAVGFPTSLVNFVNSLGIDRLNPPEIFRDEKTYDIVSTPLGADGNLTASEASVTFTLAFSKPGVYKVHVWVAVVQGKTAISSYGTQYYPFEVVVR